jgi:hypothetical protein
MDTPLSRQAALGRFCRIWLVSVLVLVSLAGVFDALVDPYLVIGAPRIAGFNAAKPETETHTLLAKTYLVRRAQYPGMMFGDSKVDIGLDPSSASWPGDSRPAFNDGLPGSGISGSLVQLRQAAARGVLRRALVFIELGEFMQPASAAPPPEAPPLQGIRQRVHDIALATLSLDALLSSVATVLAQHEPDVVDLSPEGATGDGGFRAVIARDGYAGLFSQKEAANARAQRGLAMLLAGQPDAGFNHLDTLADIVAVCREHNVALDLVIAPFSADYLDSLDRAGLWARYASAKLAITRLVAARAENARPHVGLWDFLGYDAYSADPDRTKWFWEPNHFKRALGEKILSVLYRGAGDYGVRLTPDMIEDHLAKEAQAKAAFQGRRIGIGDASP